MKIDLCKDCITGHCEQ